MIHSSLTTNVFQVDGVVLALVLTFVCLEKNGFIRTVLLGLIVFRDRVRQCTISRVLCFLPGSVLWNIRPQAVEYGMKFVLELKNEGQTYTTVSSN